MQTDRLAASWSKFEIIKVLSREPVRDLIHLACSMEEWNQLELRSYDYYWSPLHAVERQLLFAIVDCLLVGRIKVLGQHNVTILSYGL